MGFFKKAYELGVRCPVDVATRNLGPPGKRHEYSPHTCSTSYYTHILTRPRPDQVRGSSPNPRKRSHSHVHRDSRSKSRSPSYHSHPSTFSRADFSRAGYPLATHTILNDMSRFPNDCGLTRPDRDPWARAQSAGYILASAIRRRAVWQHLPLYYGFVRRLCEISSFMRATVYGAFHGRLCSGLYPLLSQTAWSMLSYNITLTSDQRWNPLSTAVYNPPSNFSDQLSSTSSVLYIDPNAPNVLFTLPNNATSGCHHLLIPSVSVQRNYLESASLFSSPSSLQLSSFLSFCAFSEISDLVAFFEAVDRGGGTGSPSSPSFVHALTSPNPNPNPNPNAGSSSDSWLDFQSNAAPASTIPLASSPDNPTVNDAYPSFGSMRTRWASRAGVGPEYPNVGGMGIDMDVDLGFDMDVDLVSIWTLTWVSIWTSTWF
ncbi:hypothetical protein BT96DRAFT_1009345 [Gymnopus androsaceus JB14]|uniref:MADS-box domain-containing protein n=1 Tax=Gymnopus androsaceus JB14 TaxID=1447944 RepID=A0A6A4GCR8_9AGAR|nr:hypothetical protein BT96DRAFT_1009345 [Gymnopus androsaceus JB14]